MHFLIRKSLRRVKIIYLFSGLELNFIANNKWTSPTLTTEENKHVWEQGKKSCFTKKKKLFWNSTKVSKHKLILT